MMKNRGVVAIMSDLVDETDRLGRGLGQMSILRQDVMLFHMEDVIERDFLDLPAGVKTDRENGHMVRDFINFLKGKHHNAFVMFSRTFTL